MQSSRNPWLCVSIVGLIGLLGLVSAVGVLWLAILGRDRCLARIDRALARL